MTAEIHPLPKETDEGKTEELDDLLSDTGNSGHAPETKLLGRVIGTLAVISMNLVMLVVINLYARKLDFISDDFGGWLPYANLALVVNIAVQTGTFFVRGSPVRHLIEVLGSYMSFVAVTMLYVIFPFDFERTKRMSSMAGVARGAILFVLVVLAIGIIANVVAFIAGLFRREPE